MRPPGRGGFSFRNSGDTLLNYCDAILHWSHPEKKALGRVEVGLFFRVGKSPVAQPGVPMLENPADPNPEGGFVCREVANLNLGG